MVLFKDMPTRVHGLIKETCTPEGEFYTIILNSRLSSETLAYTCAHEYAHIKEGDFGSPLSVDEIERLRHG